MSDAFLTEEDVAEAERARAAAGAARIEFKHLEAAFAGLRLAAIEEIINAGVGPENRAKSERLIVCLQTMETVKRALLQAVSDGEVANYRLIWAGENVLRP